MKNDNLINLAGQIFTLRIQMLWLEKKLFGRLVMEKQLNLHLKYKTYLQTWKIFGQDEGCFEVLHILSQTILM